MPGSPYIRPPAELCRDVDASARLEWWLANGIGGYAGGTVPGILTRRYHGLLVAPLQPPLGRFLLFAKADAVVVDGDNRTALHTNQWGGEVVDPVGCQRLESFQLESNVPVWRYAVNDLVVEQRIWMTHGENRTQVAFKWIAGDRDEVPHVRLGLLASYRDHHGTSHPGDFQIHSRVMADGLRLHLPGGHTIEVHSSDGAFSPNHTWFENFFLARERERGLEDIDAHLRVGHVDLRLARDRWVGISIGLDSDQHPDLEESLAAETGRAQALHRHALPGVAPGDIPPWIGQLVTAADGFIFRRRAPDGGTRPSVIAGYPWFGDWGRDTMIALPGLTLATGRPALAREILENFAGLVSEGMLPNVFPGAGATPEYNTVDAALWFIEAWRAWFEVTADRGALNAVFPVLTGIIHAYRDGTRFGIAMDPGDGLVRAGVPGQQLTWMDARVDGHEVTPRHGKPVEVNALWYNALVSMVVMARILKRDPGEFTALAAGAARGFARFDRGDGAGLYDVLDGPEGDDAAIRPNQILAVSLPFSPLASDAARRAVVDACREHLLTPFGLRSLAPADPRYVSQYAGGVNQRDGSYHQGPVWGWLLGHYALAEYRVTGDAAAAQGRLDAMAGHLAEAGLGHISEIFDGDPPHAPRGAPAQAWSAACTLEAWWRLERARRRPGAAPRANPRP